MVIVPIVMKLIFIQWKHIQKDLTEYSQVKKILSGGIELSNEKENNSLSPITNPSKEIE